MNEKLKETLINFINSFEEVFDRDWNYTKEQLGITQETAEQKQNALKEGLQSIYYISPNGTFLNPKVEDETEDWGNRRELLEQFRKLKSLISNF